MNNGGQEEHGHSRNLTVLENLKINKEVSFVIGLVSADYQLKSARSSRQVLRFKMFVKKKTSIVLIYQQILRSNTLKPCPKKELIVRLKHNAKIITGRVTQVFHKYEN